MQGSSRHLEADRCRDCLSGLRQLTQLVVPAQVFSAKDQAWVKALPRLRVYQGAPARMPRTPGLMEERLRRLVDDGREYMFGNGDGTRKVLQWFQKGGPPCRAH